MTDLTTLELLRKVFEGSEKAFIKLCKQARKQGGLSRKEVEVEYNSIKISSLYSSTPNEVKKENTIELRNSYFDKVKQTIQANLVRAQEWLNRAESDKTVTTAEVKYFLDGLWAAEVISEDTIKEITVKQ